MAVFADPVDSAARLKDLVSVPRLDEGQNLQRLVAQLVRVLVPQRSIPIDLRLDGELAFRFLFCCDWT
jgi:hypothetical protein